MVLVLNTIHHPIKVGYSSCSTGPITSLLKLQPVWSGLTNLWIPYSYRRNHLDLIEATCTKNTHFPGYFLPTILIFPTLLHKVIPDHVLTPAVIIYYPDRYTFLISFAGAEIIQYVTNLDCRIACKNVNLWSTLLHTSLWHCNVSRLRFTDFHLVPCTHQ